MMLERFAQVGWVAITLLAVACGGGGDDDEGVDAAYAGSCGDNTCSAQENCQTCQADCGQCPPGCGDNTCSATETCTTCPADCGTCACVASDPNSCDGEEICIAPNCVGAFGRTYTISVYSLTVKTTNTIGETWDAVGGAPDPYVVIALNDSTILTTDENQDTFTPFFANSTSVVIPAGAKFRFDAFDADIADDDWIIGCEIDPFTANYLRAFGPVCTGTVATGTDGTVLDILIVPN